MTTFSPQPDSGHTAPHQYPATRDVAGKSAERGGKVKAHPWRAHSPGWLASDYARGQQVIPSHARAVRK